MKYNKNIEERINQLSNSNYRKTDDATSDEFIHSNQLEAAKEIVKSFTAHMHPLDEHDARNNHVVLVAKMQSGKTGTCNGVINILTQTKLESYFGIQKYLYITGMNDNGLHNQTVERLSGKNKGQVILANEDNVCDGDKQIKEKPNAKFFVQKNSDLRKNNVKLSNCLIFIDESHFGSNKSNVLTKFLEENGVDWKNKKVLKDKQIYIVSVSATPFDEIISDVADCKTIVELQTSELYIGVSEYLDSECIYEAKKSDFKIDKTTNKTPVIDYIKNAFEAIKKNNDKGVIFIRTRDTTIKKQDLIIDNFKIVDLDARGGSIDYKMVYKDIQAMIDASVGTETSKPIIFFVKGAYRAGITLDSKHKDYVFMVYDDSVKAEATAQGLLGRMCGYRNENSNYKNTIFYINKQHAEDYAEWEEDFKKKNNIPTQRAWKWIEETDVLNKDCESKIATKCHGNIAIDLTDEQIKRFIQASLDKNITNKDFAKNEIRILNSELNFDYFGESYISGKNSFSESVVRRWFENFKDDTYCPSYRADSFFKLNTGREILTDKDLDKIIVHVVLDSEVDIDDDNNIVNISGNKKLLIYRGILSKKIKVKNTNNLIKEHKKTQL